MTTIALALGLAMVNIWRPGVGMHINPGALDTSAVASYIARVPEQGIVPFLLNVIPSTLVGAFAEGNVLQVLLIAVLFGAALVGVGDRAKAVVAVLEPTGAVLFRIVGIVMWAAPAGAFGAIAFTVARYGAGTLWSLGHLLVSFYVTCLIFVFGILTIVARLCGFSLLALIRSIREELLIVFATTSSETVLPRIITKLELLGCRRDVVGLVIPTGYSFNLDGTCLYLATTTVFLAQATDTPLDAAATDRAADGAAADVQGVGGRGRRRVRGPRGDVIDCRPRPGRERGARAGDSQADVRGSHANEPDRQRGRNAGGSAMGERAGRRSAAASARGGA